MNIYIFENNLALNLEPITLTRPAFDVRCGLYTCIERLNFLLPDDNIHLVVRSELEEITKETFPGYSVNFPTVEKGIWLLGNVLWSIEDIETVKKQQDTVFYNNDISIAANLSQKEAQSWMDAGGPVENDLQCNNIKSDLNADVIEYLWQAITLNIEQINKDLKFLSGYTVPNSEATLINSKNVYAHHSAMISKGAVVDASHGPVVIASDVHINPLTYLKGPLYLGENCVVEPFAQLKGGCSIGPVCKLGGELNSVIIQGWSNKVHEGHLGDAYLGQWVNLGAGTVNSNLKNNYSDISVMVNGKMTKTDSKHVGCFIGDHVKTAIGTRLNTGTVIGAGSNIVSNKFPPKTIPPFSWCIGDKVKPARWDAFLATAKIVKSRRGLDLSSAEISLLDSIYRRKKTQ